jgi:hypothetical protein
LGIELNIEDMPAIVMVIGTILILGFTLPWVIIKLILLSLVAIWALETIGFGAFMVYQNIKDRRGGTVE